MKCFTEENIHSVLSWLKTQHSKKKIMASSPHFMANRWGKYGNCQIPFSWTAKSMWTVTTAMKL